MKRIFQLTIAVFVILAANAQNPIVPPGVYIADPSAHVWPDGKLYVYGSRDESPNYYCSWSYRVLFTSDLKTWNLSSQSFASKAAGDEVPYSDAFLYAPDAQYRNGLYYLYYCLADGKHTEGVATGTSPLGPFKNGTDIALKNKGGIDPCVFIDDDGQAYMIWGQFSAKMAKLKRDMKTLDESTIKDSVITQKEHHFHEGSYMIKRNGIYYLLYADISRADMPTCIGYATSSSPMGPFTYRGVIVDNSHCDPANWNNHGSLVKYGEQWYVFYHRATNGCNTMRKACVEPIKFNKDGSISEVEMTSQGAGGPLDAYNTIDAAKACLMMGNIRIQTYSLTNEVLGGIKQGNKAAYKYLDFDEGADSITMRIAPGKKPCTIEVMYDDAWGSTAAMVDVPAATAEGQWIEITTKVKTKKGVHAVWFQFFEGSEEELCKVDEFRFIRN